MKLLTMKLLILDKDGTLTTPKSGGKFVQSPNDQTLLPGAAEAVLHYRSQGYDLAIATNQGGVAAGFKTIEDATAEVDYCLKLLPMIKDAALCPDFEGELAWIMSELMEWTPIPRSALSGIEKFRKPGCGMLQLFMMDSVEYSHILYVGDREEDMLAAKQMGCDFMWAKDWRRDHE